MVNFTDRFNGVISDCLSKALYHFDHDEFENFEVNVQRALTLYDTLKRVKSLIKALDAIDETEKANTAE